MRSVDGDSPASLRSTTDAITGLALGVLLLIAGGCASSRSQDDFARELVSRSAPEPAFRSIGEEVTVRQRTIDAVRTALASEGQLMAFVQLPQGVHPFMVVVFLRRDETVELLLTSVYWGRIQGKWQASIDLETAESLVQWAIESFECTPGPVVDSVFGATLISWEAGQQVTCDGGWGTEEGAAFGELFQPIADGAQNTYAAPL